MFLAAFEAIALAFARRAPILVLTGLDGICEVPPRGVGLRLGVTDRDTFTDLPDGPRETDLVVLIERFGRFTDRDTVADRVVLLIFSLLYERPVAFFIAE